MRTSNAAWCLTAGLVWTALVGASAAEGDEAARLVQQLGSARYAEREAACQALDRLGAPALPALRSAVGGGSPEVQRRAEALIQTIEQRCETEELLRPTKLALHFQDRPLAEAAAELSRQAGFALDVVPDGRQLTDRRVTLITPELSFWEAFDRLCQAAEVTPLARQVRRTTTVNPANGSLPPVPTVMLGDPRLTLVAGKPPAVPTCYAGAMRLRVLPPADQDQPTHPGVAALMLEIAVEPRLQWRSLIQVRLAEVRDDKGQALIPLESEEPVRLTEDDLIRLQMRNLAQQQRAVAMKLDLGPGVQRGGLGQGIFQTPLRFQVPAAPGRKLPLLKGGVLAQIQTPVLPVITVEDVTTVGQRAYRGRDGSELKVLQTFRRPSGQVEVQLEFQPAAGTPVGPGANNVQVQLRPGPNGGTILAASGNPFVLKDAEGQAFQLIGQRSSLDPRNGQWVQSLTLTYQPPRPAAVPRTLVYSASRLATVEVPFAFRDVPLP
jgi:hypothetical protein